MACRASVIAAVHDTCGRRRSADLVSPAASVAGEELPEPGAAILMGCRSPLRPQIEWRFSVLIAAAAHQHLAPDRIAHVSLDETEYGVRHIARADHSDVSCRTASSRAEIRTRESVQHRDRRRVLDLGLKFEHWARSCVEYTGEEPTANWNMLIVSPRPDRPSGGAPSPERSSAPAKPSALAGQPLLRRAPAIRAWLRPRVRASSGARIRAQWRPHLPRRQKTDWRRATPRTPQRSRRSQAKIGCPTLPTPEAWATSTLGHPGLGACDAKHQKGWAGECGSTLATTQGTLSNTAGSGQGAGGRGNH